jgi:hypothetical protein
MRLPFVSRRRYRKVAAERDELWAQNQDLGRKLVIVARARDKAEGLTENGATKHLHREGYGRPREGLSPDAVGP